MSSQRKKESLIGYIKPDWKINKWSDGTAQFNYNKINLKKMLDFPEYKKVRITIEEIK